LAQHIYIVLVLDDGLLRVRRKPSLFLGINDDEATTVVEEKATDAYLQFSLDKFSHVNESIGTLLAELIY
jgi:hypothetical protein